MRGPCCAAWQQAIPQLDSQADVLIVLSFGGLPQGGGSSRPTAMKEVAGWMETHAKALPIGVDTAFVEGGGGLAISPSPREMGEVAMQMSLVWLRAVANGQPAARRWSQACTTAWRCASRRCVPRRGAALDLRRGGPARPQRLPLNASGR